MLKLTAKDWAPSMRELHEKAMRAWAFVFTHAKGAHPESPSARADWDERLNELLEAAFYASGQCTRYTTLTKEAVERFSE